MAIPFLCQIVYVRGDFERDIFHLYDSLELEDCVQFIPELPQKDIIKYYSGADCFALPCESPAVRTETEYPLSYWKPWQCNYP